MKRVKEDFFLEEDLDVREQVGTSALILFDKITGSINELPNRRFNVHCHSPVRELHRRGLSREYVLRIPSVS